MKIILLVILAVMNSNMAFADTTSQTLHETVCGGKSLEAAEALLRLNHPDIESVDQDSQSMKLVAHTVEGDLGRAAEIWNISLNVKTKSNKWRSTIIQVAVKAEFLAQGRVICTIRSLSTPFAD